MTGIPIYQFCRAFDNVRKSDVYGFYVSGGYAFEKITRWNKEVPEEIRQAVINGSFALNDNYPPEEDDFALIAREIDDKYSVLAVANRQLDDGGRPTIGYKYFWLDKSRLSQYVDGIGTLIYWWDEQKQPKFDMAELVEQSAPEIFYCGQEVQKRNFQEPWLKETWATVEKLPSIPHTVIVTKQEWKGLPEYIKLHYLALGLSLRTTFKNACAWAWNVNKIAFPENFLAIFYATPEDIPKNLRKFSLSPLYLPSPQTHNPHNSDPNSNNSAITATTQNTSPLAKNPGQIAPDKKIRKCLTDIATIFTNQCRLDTTKTNDLFGYLKDYPDEDWSNFIDKTTLNAPSGNENYKELIYLIAPNHISSQKWLLKMVASLEMETKQASLFEDFRNKTINLLGLSEDNNQPTIPEFQRILLEASSNYDVQVSQKLENSIYFGISFLLEKVTNPDQRTDVEKIKYLLIQSQTIWSDSFKLYAKLVAANILYEDNDNNKKYQSIIDFSQQIIEILEKIKNTNHKNQHYRDYHALAQIFREIEQKDLSELFYRMSGNSGNQIPQDVRTGLSNEIRSRIFGVPNQTMFGQVSSTPSSHNDHNDRGDGGAKAIFGFLFFLAGNIIFFTSITHWPKLIIPRVLTYLIFTISAIVLTGNPFKIRNVNIQAALSFIYLFVAVAFLVGSFDIQAISKNQICSNVNLMESYENFEKCYKSTQETQQLKIMNAFVPNDPENKFAKDQAKLANKYISESTDREMFDERKKKLEFCKSTKYTFYGECVTAKDRDFTSY
ncbi:hypothetical protein [Anabaena sp. UHCC 0451]|uniref:hypothetical protein n=1 Tax=Anabaena sp. UHCC 0451 TaxID=2055235 RepID=UPI002B205888|nr:hypothetical protein [Anabaena sp. UHCC 0451]MEA5578255.1 hypothetical protein [Anabaena sp. UHCC 0451]